MKKLQRGLGLFETTVIGVGTIVGAGIYVLLGKVVELTGPSAWLSFIIAAILALFTGLSYAELTSMFAKDSSEYYYVRQAFNSKTLAFLTGWLCIIAGIIGIAVVSLGFAGYFNYLFNTPIFLSAIGIIVFLSIVNYIGIKQSAAMNAVFTLASIGGLLIVIYAGTQSFGSVNYLEALAGFHGIFKASALVFFAYIGFEVVVRLAQETREPKKVLPKAILLSIIISTILYIGVAISSVSILSVEELSMSSAPLSDIIFKGFGQSNAFIVSILAVFATLSTILALLIGTSRLLFGMSEENALPSVLQRISPFTKTPGIAVFMTGLGASIFVLFKNLGLIASLVNFSIFLIFILVNLSLIFLRISAPQLDRPFKVPLNIKNIPILSIFAVLICCVMLIQFSAIIFLGGFILILIGLIFYEFLSKSQNFTKGHLDSYRVFSLISSLFLLVIGSVILIGGYLIGEFWWTGMLWVVLGIFLFLYTYLRIFRE